MWADTAWTARYYRSIDFQGQTKVIEETVLTHDWGKSAPFPGWPKNEFSVQWTRTDLFHDGAYTFAILHDDGARIYVDGELIYDNWSPGFHDWAAVQYQMTAGKHRLTIEYYDEAQEAVIQFGYSLNQ
jgi:hypothetical protein